MFRQPKIQESSNPFGKKGIIAGSRAMVKLAKLILSTRKSRAISGINLKKT